MFQPNGTTPRSREAKMEMESTWTPRKKTRRDRIEDALELVLYPVKLFIEFVMFPTVDWLGTLRRRNWALLISVALALCVREPFALLTTDASLYSVIASFVASAFIIVVLLYLGVCHILSR